MIVKVLMTAIKIGMQKTIALMILKNDHFESNNDYDNYIENDNNNDNISFRKTLDV